MAFEEANHGGEKGGLAGPAAKLICVDSGQVEEPPCPPFVGEHGGERRQRQDFGVICRAGRHGVAYEPELGD